mmetsp:Transcript_41502/g.120082  ORF Transcript_41502/g.120082 Transcript_41502/m.120082 type:complete len:265 (+) Transcript_41502:454-1248(+)
MSATPGPNSCSGNLPSASMLILPSLGPSPQSQDSWEELAAPAKRRRRIRQAGSVGKVTKSPGSDEEAFRSGDVHGHPQLSSCNEFAASLASFMPSVALSWSCSDRRQTAAPATGKEAAKGTDTCAKAEESTAVITAVALSKGNKRIALAASCDQASAQAQMTELRAAKLSPVATCTALAAIMMPVPPVRTALAMVTCLQTSQGSRKAAAARIGHQCHCWTARQGGAGASTSSDARRTYSTVRLKRHSEIRKAARFTGRAGSTAR